jgi:Carboxypeptidase regulatory-like domain/TonB-dependent Receptor Plug Domain
VGGVQLQETNNQNSQLEKQIIEKETHEGTTHVSRSVFNLIFKRRIIMTNLRRGLILIACLLSLSRFASAQGSGSVVGTVTDSTGNVVPRAKVVAANLRTLIERTTVTTDAGEFQIPGLPAGNYTIEVSHTGFKALKSSEFAVNVGQERRVNLTLEVGAVTETVTVQATAAAAVTETATLSTVVDQKSIVDLPLNGRQLQNLALLVPGVTAGWKRTVASDKYASAREGLSGAFVVNGARGRSNDFILDGVPMNLLQYGVVNFIASNEAVQEFEVKTSVSEAEYGRTMGSTVNMVTRSGGNEYHGSLYEFLRNDFMDANNTFNKQSNEGRGVLRQNQFGGSFGGPIVRNKHFFFANTELTRIVEGTESRLTSVPTPAEKAGRIEYTDAEGSPQILDLSGRITPLSARLLQFYPLPNVSTTSGFNYTTPLPIVLNDYQVHVRTDHQLTERDTLMARVSWNLNDQDYLVYKFYGPYIPGFNLPNPETTSNGTVGHLHTFGGAVVNELRFGWTRYSNDLGNGDKTNATEIGLPNGYDLSPGIPAINFLAGGLADLGGRSLYGDRWQNETSALISDTLSWSRGRHNFKLGAQIARYHLNTRGAVNQRGTVEFDGSRNGLIPATTANARANTLADLLLGLPVRASITVGEFGRGYRQWAYAGFIQDSWRATPKLTVNLGLRYEYNKPWTEVNGKLTNLVPGGSLELVGSPALKNFYQPDRNNFGPRVGLAYDLSGNGKTVIRVGIGVVYETLQQTNSVEPVENNPPFSLPAVVRLPAPFSATSAPSTTLLDLRTSAQPSRAIAAVGVNDFRNPYAMQTNFSVQRMLTPQLLLEVGYAGTRGVRLPVFTDLNQVPLERLTPVQRASIAAEIAAGRDTTPILSQLRPYPQYDSITYSSNAASSTYHSLQLKLEKRFGTGPTLLGAYTFAKSIDNASDYGSFDSSEMVLDSNNLARQRGLSSFDIKHRFSLAFNYNLPFKQLLPGPKGLLDGWQVNGIISLQTGQPFTPFLNTLDPYRNESFNRPNVVGDPNAEVPEGYAFNPAAFQLAAPGTFGNAGRNIVRGDGFRSVDLSLFKNIRITERFGLQMRFESVNSFNHTNFQGPATNLVANGGLYIAAAQPRILQLGCRLSF